MRKLGARAGDKAKLPFPNHPHMLRHSTGYKLANHGHDTRAIQHYLGHRNITHTVRYTQLGPERFRGFGRIECEVRRVASVRTPASQDSICSRLKSRDQVLGTGGSVLAYSRNAYGATDTWLSL